MNKLNIQLPQLSESVFPADQIAPMESEPQSLLVQNTTTSNMQSLTALVYLRQTVNLISYYM